MRKERNNGREITIREDMKIPGTSMILEAGDSISVVDTESPYGSEDDFLEKAPYLAPPSSGFNPKDRYQMIAAAIDRFTLNSYGDADSAGMKAGEEVGGQVAMFANKIRNKRNFIKGVMKGLQR